MRTTFAAVLLAALVAAPAHANDRLNDCLSLPVKGPFVTMRIFGAPNDPFPGTHDGIDLGVPVGRRVYAMAGGTVTDAGHDTYGANVVIVRTKSGRFYVLGHMRQILVRRGEKVHRGQVLGLSGGAPHDPGSGRHSTGPHLHFGVTNGNSTFIDPAPLLCQPLTTQRPSR